jgi:hypothetical protein
MMNRRQRIMLIAILIFGVVPAALTVLFLASGVGYAIPGALVYYYVLAIAGITILLFEQLWKEVRGPKQTPY